MLPLPCCALEVVLTLGRRAAFSIAAVNENSGTGHDNEVAVFVLLKRCAAQRTEQKRWTDATSRRHRQTQRCTLLVRLVFANGAQMVRFLLLDMSSQQSQDECFVCITHVLRRRHVLGP